MPYRFLKTQVKGRILAMKNLVKKSLAEFFGSAFLVLFGCGSAVFVGCSSSLGAGYLLTALAFGLTLTLLICTIGDLSGCHVNPAVSLAMLINKKMKLSEFFAYIASQFLGGILGGAILFLIVKTGNVVDLSGDYLEGISALGSNSISNVGNNVWIAVLIEALLTFVFVLSVLKITEKPSNGLLCALTVGLSLTLVHIVGIALTGTSVNPARSLGVAIFAGGAFLANVWAFIVGPFIGALLAAFVYPLLSEKK